MRARASALRPSSEVFIIGRMIKNWGLGLLLLGLGGCAQLQGRSQRVPPGFQGVVEFDERRLSFVFSGRLTSLAVREGSPVAADQVVATLDPTLENALTQVRVKEAEAASEQVAVARAPSRPEERRSLEARIRATRATEQKLARNLERERALLASGAVAPATVDDLNNELARVTAEREALEQNLKLLERGARNEDVVLAKARAQASEANVTLQQQRLDYYQLRSAVNGEVLAVHAETGEVVAAGAPVLTVADVAHPYVDVFIPQGQIGGVHVGDGARIRVDSHAEELKGAVEFIARSTEFTPRFLFSDQERPNLVLRVRVRVEDAAHVLHAGIPAFVQLDQAPTVASQP